MPPQPPARRSRHLPALDPDAFASGLLRACRNVLRDSSAVDLSPATLRALHLHYRELRRWNPRLALIGPGTVDEVLERHYAESLAALPLLPPAPGVLLDIGSGAGFPGWVLAAARPDLSVTLVEARERKWSFLSTATRKAASAERSPWPSAGKTDTRPLPIHCLNARVDLPLPEELPGHLDAVTLRALKLEPQALAALGRRLRPAGRFLLWLGAETPALPPNLLPGRELPLAGSERRRILEVLRP